jgi:hypothetical protein
LEEPTLYEEEEEQGLVRNVCIKALLFLLVGYTIFANKNIKNVSLIWLLAFQDFDRLGERSWGGIAPAFLYSQLSLTLSAKIKVIGGYMTLLEVIKNFLFFSWITNVYLFI